MLIFHLCNSTPSRCTTITGATTTKSRRVSHTLPRPRRAAAAYLENSTTVGTLINASILQATPGEVRAGSVAAGNLIKERIRPDRADRRNKTNRASARNSAAAQTGARCY